MSKATAKREVETGFMEDSADTSQKTGHSKSPGAAVSRGWEGSKEISGSTEATGEADQVKQKEKKPGRLAKIRKSLSKHSVQSSTSPTSPSDASPRLSKRAEETTEREGHQTSEGASASATCPTPNLPPNIEVKGHPPTTTTTTTAAAPESLALVSMSEVAGQEREEDWLMGETVGLRLKLAAQKSDQDQLHHQLEQTEATVRQLETDLMLSQARVAELEGEITKLEEQNTGMKALLSESEHNRQGLFQELSKVKQRRHMLDQKYLSLLALNENLKSQASQVDYVLDEITQVKREASKWKEILSIRNAEVGVLKKENDDLKGEIEAQKAQAALWEEDFQRERHDRELAAGRRDEERAQLYIQNQRVREDFQTRIHQLESENKGLQDEIKVYQDEKKSYKQVMTDYDRMQLQLVQHKEQVTEMEQLFQTEAALWEEDFQRERHDRELAAGRRDEERAQLYIQNQRVREDFQTRIHQLESENKGLQDEIKVYQDEKKSYKQVMTDYDRMQLQLVQHKEQVTEMEQLFQTQQQLYKTKLEQANQLQRTQLEDVHRQLRLTNQRLDQAVTDNEKLDDDVMAKTQQVKQYKKQVDGLKAEVTKYKKQVDGSEAEVTMYKSQVTAKEELLYHLVAERDALLQQQLQLRQQIQGKDQFIQNLQSEKDQLRQRVSILTEEIPRYPQQPQSQHSHQSDFWEVPRNDITLNMHKILGIGAWGFVVEGIFRGQKVAVKCLHDMIRLPEAIATIRKEIGIMAQIRHPNLVMLIAAVIDAKNDPLIVTELLDISLRKAYEKHHLQGSSMLSIFRDVASALNYLHLHQRGEIIHRDVSSANVLLEAKPNNQWKAKLSDFGSAKLAIEAKTTGPGAPAYTAPEVRKEMGIRQTAKLDVYSYGILLCEVIVGQFPTEGSLPSMMQVVQSTWPFMHGLATSCIQEHPDNRPTMSYVLGEFDKLGPQK